MPFYPHPFFIQHPPPCNQVNHWLSLYHCEAALPRLEFCKMMMRRALFSCSFIQHNACEIYPCCLISQHFPWERASFPHFTEGKMQTQTGGWFFWRSLLTSRPAGTATSIWSILDYILIKMLLLVLNRKDRNTHSHMVTHDPYNEDMLSPWEAHNLISHKSVTLAQDEHLIIAEPISILLLDFSTVNKDKVKRFLLKAFGPPRTGQGPCFLHCGRNLN